MSAVEAINILFKKFINTKRDILNNISRSTIGPEHFLSEQKFAFEQYLKEIGFDENLGDDVNVTMDGVFFKDKMLENKIKEFIDKRPEILI